MKGTTGRRDRIQRRLLTPARTASRTERLSVACGPSSSAGPICAAKAGCDHGAGLDVLNKNQNGKAVFESTVLDFWTLVLLKLDVSGLFHLSITVFKVKSKDAATQHYVNTDIKYYIYKSTHVLYHRHSLAQIGVGVGSGHHQLSRRDARHLRRFRAVLRRRQLCRQLAPLAPAALARLDDGGGALVALQRPP